MTMRFGFAGRWLAAPPTGLLRIWDGFATARVVVAAALLLLQALIQAMGQQHGAAFVAVCFAYLAATFTVRICLRPRRADATLGPLWLPTIGVDLLAYSAMQVLQSGGMNYTPLLGLPVLMASVLGTRRMALGTAAGVTLLLLADATLLWPDATGFSTPRLLQAGLTGLGYFVIAVLVQPLVTRLGREEAIARSSQRAAALQAQVNELVIETLTDGVLVVDANGMVRAANPSARVLLDAGTHTPPFSLADQPAWEPLAELARRTVGDGGRQMTDVALVHPGHGPRRLHVRTRLTPLREHPSETLCVMFLQDLRETEARLRTEKLAAMGRMSAAVAHEIRNPLAAIVQANALLDEDLHDPAQRQLSALVRQNAQRLAKIAEEVLDVSRVQRQLDFDGTPTIPLDETVGSVCTDWHGHAGQGCGLQVATEAGAGVRVDFDPDHLRRVLVNLLDNALRYIGPDRDALQVRTWVAAGGQTLLEVWSDGAPLEQMVEQRLFEPFFSSESRSSGLGLYICRELCERHGAGIGYRRVERATALGPVEGNAFTVAFRTPHDAAADSPFDTIVV
ncbi:sensor histidine kinase [Xylophilus ampelinus]|uniref:histidine kinase n=1 Tax=Xylophilus ampelinus TaxID=54067 RepID=A0A318SNC3_9BURK|nr:ATP-binding protein [Xylophilus ampelinus]MCS4509679.1 ATP-binding protein [Xylophilus ampelinus]PYE78835.1 two-component system sensor histidine kinase PilS (NtrC family) [Xylophilus ampelinus]